VGRRTALGEVLSERDVDASDTSGDAVVMTRAGNGVQAPVSGGVVRRTIDPRTGLPGARAIGWRDIEVTRDDEGRPAIRLHGVAQQLAEEQGGVRIQVSLTHSSTAAGAVAVVSSA